LLPKAETGVTAFLDDHKKYDGRGIVVAIFDTGVDPGAAGLQVTSDGKPKIVDLVDGSGSGDVATTTVRQVEDGVLQGLTGRELRPGKWKNPSGEYHLGIKAAWEIYPQALVRRMTGKRRERWDAEHRERTAQARDALLAFDAKTPSPTEAELRDRVELQARLTLLAKMQEDYDDPGPVFDCVVFHDGKHWRAVIDTDEDGDLGDEKAMTNYRVAREWATFDAESLYNFAVNIYQDGNLLSIVSDCGSHGTHVAGIVAANYPNRQEMNGIAPGVQIVSVKIGDTRIGSSSMGPGQARGLVAVLENRCDLINMSYGGSSPLPNASHMVKLYDEIVNDHGVIFVASAGNSGPALSTAGSPGGTSSSLIGVGATVSAEMMRAQYSMREKLPDTQYTWSSRGPTTDGDLGVDISAPGGAIAPVPNWSLQPNGQKNGTSMAAPSTCGGIALLLSGLRAKGLDWTPQQVKRAIQNTGQDLPGVERFAIGRGVLRVDRAWEWLQKHQSYSKTGVRFDVSVPGRDRARGIYLREPDEQLRPVEENVVITPRFRNNVDNHEKVEFQMEVALAVDADWVQAPDVLHLHAGGRSFRVLVDPRVLPTGAHYAEITGTDMADPSAGPFFRVPITVIRPQEVPPHDPTWMETLHFAPGEIQRRFFAVPPGATWADLEISGLDHETARRLVVHAVQLENGMEWDQHQTRLTRWVDEGENVVRSFPVVGGGTLELALAHYWSSLGKGSFSFELTFHGLVPRDERLFLDGAFPALRSSVRATIRNESIAPSAKLTHRRTVLRPVDHELRPLPGNRDLLPERKREHELVLTYEFELDEDSEVWPRSTLNQDWRLWEYYESGLWILFDERKQRVAVGPILGSFTKLDKGKYTLRYHLRHPDAERLQELIGMSIALDTKLGKSLALTVHADEGGALGDSAPFGTRHLRRGEAATFWLGSPAFSELPDGVKEGDLLLGSIAYGRELDDHVGSGRRPEGFEVAVSVPPPPQKEEEPEASAEEDESGEGEEEGGDDSVDTLGDELRDLQVAHLATLHDEERKDDFERLAAQILQSDAEHLPVYLEKMRRLAAVPDEDRESEAIVTACDDVISRVDQVQVAAALGVDVDPDDDAAKKHRGEMEEQRDYLVEAMRTKCEALQDADGAEALFESAFRELDRWADTEDEDHAMLLVARERRRGRIAVALETVNGRIADKGPDRELLEKRIELLTEMGWERWVAYERSWLIRRLPEEFAPF
jgi:tripeptidyl-peptidase-2